MIKHDQNGGVTSLLLPFIIMTILFIASVSFAFWAYNSRQDYKLNTDQKIAVAVTLARQDESTAKDKQFAEVQKQPLRTYTGPQAFGSLIVQYPKTWSGYVDDTGNGNSPVDGYFYPGTVPSLTNPNSSFALRVQIIPQSYTSVMAGFRGLVQGQKVTVSPYSLPKVPSVVGVQISGLIKPTKSGVMVVLPLRDKTIEISTEGSEFVADFNNNILPNLSFSP